MYVSIGSASNVSDDSEEANRARIFEFNPDGTGQKVFAWGVRNAVGIKFRPGTEDLWMSVNERDALGDGLVPDYISRVQPGGFYGWPWFYMGKHQDPRHKGKHPELADKVLVPDVLVQSHSASLNLCLLRWATIPGRIQGRHLRGFPRLLEQDAAHRLQNRPRAVRQSDRQSAGRLRRFRHRLRHAGRKRLGPARRHHGRERWQPALQRRWEQDHLARELRRSERQSCHPEPRRRRGTSSRTRVTQERLRVIRR